ncbi:immunity 49 family protein [Limibacter armeniacum]|uniref:immunity 49 family protein n=1 Tax=Limibacter armeniacum TaxID=466084 RepID=UPI002FE66E6A
MQLYIFKERITPKGEPFTVPIAGKVAEGRGVPVGEYTSAADWMLCWHWCMITKYREGITVLEQVSDEVFKKDTSRVEPFHYKIVNFYKKLFQKSDIVQQAFKEAYEYTDIQKYPPSHEYLEELVLFLYAPLLEVFLGIITKNATLYNEKLYEGLKLFKDFVEREPEDEDDIPRTAEYHWFIAWGYLAAVRLAQLNGLKTEVSSGYLPDWLVEGDFDQLPVTLPEME